jgi:hypothetical protein
MYTIFSAVQRQHRKSDVMMSFGLTACSAIYYQVPHCMNLAIQLLFAGGQKMKRQNSTGFAELRVMLY